MVVGVPRGPKDKHRSDLQTSSFSFPPESVFLLSLPTPLPGLDFLFLASLVHSVGNRRK